MAVIARRVKKFTGVLTTDGSGNATADVVFGAAGGAAIPSGTPSYKLIRVTLSNGDTDFTVPLTGGTVNVRDNSGAGSAVNYTVNVDGSAGLTASAGGGLNDKPLDAPTPVTNVRITIAGGGASKKLHYAMWFARVRAH